MEEVIAGVGRLEDVDELLKRASVVELLAADLEGHAHRTDVGREPAWVADGRPVYGGFFWLNTDGAFPVPRDAYYMAGAGGQFTMIVPSHDLVVVRLGHYRGSGPGTESFKRALALLMQAVPPRR